MVHVRVTNIHAINKHDDASAVECSLIAIDKEYAGRKFKDVMVPYPLVKKGDEFIVSIESELSRPVFRRWRRNPSRVRHFGV